MLGHLLVFQRWVNSAVSLAKATERPCSAHVLFVLMGMAVRGLKTCVAVNVNATKAKHRHTSEHGLRDI